MTCGTASQSDLYGEELNVREEPSRDATIVSSQGKILVSYSESVMWSFAAEECQTWFVSISKAPCYSILLTCIGVHFQVSRVLASHHRVLAKEPNHHCGDMAQDPPTSFTSSC